VFDLSLSLYTLHTHTHTHTHTHLYCAHTIFTETIVPVSFFSLSVSVRVNSIILGANIRERAAAAAAGGCEKEIALGIVNARRALYIPI